MTRTVRFFSFSIAALFCQFIAVTAYGQVPQWCPPAGMMMKGKNNQGEVVRTMKGADPADSTVCVYDLTGPGAGINYGKTLRAIYLWYPLQNFAMTAETEQRARAGLGAILSDQTKEVSFEMTNHIPGAGTSWSGTETWQRTGEASIAVRPCGRI